MKVNVHLFGNQYMFRVDKNPYYKSRRAIRKSGEYWTNWKIKNSGVQIRQKETNNEQYLDSV